MPRSAPGMAFAQPLDGERCAAPRATGRIVRWLKREGDEIAANELVAEIETDKALVDIEAPCAGTLGQILHSAGETVAMGQRIGFIRAR